MDQIHQKNKILNLLAIAATEYKKLLNKKIILHSKNFLYSNEYVIRFYETNFLHLTGLKTFLTPKDFFFKSLNKTISVDDITDFTEKNKLYTIKNKLDGLKDITLCFSNNLQVQENFKRNSINCTIATSDGNRTIGFIKAGSINRPMTFLNKNKLNQNEPIQIVKPIIINITH